MLKSDHVSVRISPSKTGGYGVFASSDYDAGVFVRKRIILRQVTKMEPLHRNEDHNHLCIVDGKLFLVGEPDCYINHSCDPNCYLLFEEASIRLTAKTQIATGDEITLDYLINNGGGNSWPCNCGSDRCRSMTGESFFTLPAEFQREYFPLLAEWFIQAHKGKIRQLEASFAKEKLCASNKNSDF